ncbi:hypothetical protein CWM47_11955 [Spirosoma pollinicola]|uniref:Cytochrome B n=2 Tax=Spirosoma pollinicola TaxID=2057025 RepID=A0A2K8YXW2_9BACT|nr:hypothetical protein CWM47_11955 [Spirosoma pollinicola]
MVYPILLVIHNAFRWLVLSSLLATLGSSYSGWLWPRSYRPFDQTIRIVATSIVHTQLLIGFYLYFISPLIRYYWRFKPDASQSPEFRFFSIIHINLMFTAVIVVTIGSSLAKRKATAQGKFRTTAIYFTIGLVLILIAVPWPFSPLASRGWFRAF